jgi:hypothetical protein
MTQKGPRRPQVLHPTIRKMIETHARDAARREERHTRELASEGGSEPAGKRFGSSIRPNASNDGADVRRRRSLGEDSPEKARPPIESTAVDVAGSMFVASAELVLSTLEELKAHVGAVRTKEEVEDILGVQIARWREAVTQFRAERSRIRAGNKPNLKNKTD